MPHDKGKRASGLLRLTLSLVIFGTVGLVRRFVAFPSGFTAFVRGAIGALIILAIMLILKRKPSLRAIKKNAPILLLSGGFLGINWILLFEAYRYTTVASACLVYYMAPILVIIASPLLLKSRVASVKWIAVAAAFLGMVLVSEPWKEGFLTSEGAVGILLALGAAFFYAGVTVLNKRLDGIEALDRTAVQLAAAAAVVLPYTLIAEEVTADMLDARSILLTLALALVHTGVAYFLFFSSIELLPAPTVAVLSYLDPILAVILSALILGEPMSPPAIIGAALILSAALFSELIPEKK